MTTPPPLPVQLLIFGGAGDLARRKLLPALVRLGARSRLPSPLTVVAVGRRALSDDAYRGEMREAMPADLRPAFDAFAPALHYRSADVEDDASLARLRTDVDGIAGGVAAGRLCYLALKPGLFAPAVTKLRVAGLLHRHEYDDGPFRRVIVEKPFGHDLASARALNEQVHRELDEHQVLRIDHYLGKETVLNLLGLRFHNAIFEPLWNRHHVELVQISVAETLGVGAERAPFYDDTGALRDVLQNHLLQILALVAMEPPTSLEADALRAPKVEVLRALRAPDPEEVARHAVRAQYVAGDVGGLAVPGYRDEVARPSDTETYVAVRAEIDNWRWQGVPFLLRHGKRMARRLTEVRVQFRMPPLQLFNRPPDMSDAELQRQVRAGTLCLVRPNVLVIGIQPEETIGLTFGVKRPGPQMTMAQASLAFDYRAQFGEPAPDAYERLLQDAFAGDASLFLRADEIEASWRFCDAVRHGWDAGGVPLRTYPAGSWGPAEADALFYGCEGGWSRG